jgi:hypothetical protein
MIMGAKEIYIRDFSEVPAAILTFINLKVTLNYAKYYLA